MNSGSMIRVKAQTCILKTTRLTQQRVNVISEYNQAIGPAADRNMACCVRSVWGGGGGLWNTPAHLYLWRNPNPKLQPGFRGNEWVTLGQTPLERHKHRGWSEGVGGWSSRRRAEKRKLSCQVTNRCPIRPIYIKDNVRYWLTEDPFLFVFLFLIIDVHSRIPVRITGL